MAFPVTLGPRNWRGEIRGGGRGERCGRPPGGSARLVTAARSLLGAIDGAESVGGQLNEGNHGMTDLARGLEGLMSTETRLSKVHGRAGHLTIAAAHWRSLHGQKPIDFDVNLAHAAKSGRSAGEEVEVRGWDRELWSVSRQGARFTGRCPRHGGAGAFRAGW